jgi:hypothetical protein
MRAAGKVQKLEAAIVPVLPVAARRLGHPDKANGRARHEKRGRSRVFETRGAVLRQRYFTCTLMV